jgi:transcription antitermination factor NusG
MLKLAPEPEAEIIDGLWYVCVSESQQEVAAATGLHSRGFSFYLPTYPKIIKGSYRIPRTVYRPMLPGYLFASFDPNENGWKSIPAISGIRRIMMTNEQPIPVPEAALAFIRQREAQMQADFGTGKRRWPMPVAVGAWVQIRDHTSFGGLFGRVIQLLAEKGKLVLEIELLSRKTRVELPADSVKAV